MMAAYTAAYVYDGLATPDTVMRLYDSACTFLGEIDDFPYWALGTDSALYWQATDPSGYYVEILEFSDWLDDDLPPAGSPDWDYELWVEQFDLSAFEWGANDDMDEADATWKRAEADPEDELGTYHWLWADPVDLGYASAQTFGEIGEPGDQDWWVYEVDASSVTDFPYLQISFWNGYYGELQPLLSLYDEDGALTARTTDPAYMPGQSWMPSYVTRTMVWQWDAGITVRLPPSGGRFYVVVEDASDNGGTGAGYFYPLIVGGPFALATDPWELEPNDPEELANTVAMSVSTTGTGYIGRFAGVLDSADDDDGFEVLSSDVGGLGGRYLNVYGETAIHGSLLDGRITVYAEAGDGTFTELITATEHPTGESTDDPTIWDLLLDSDADVTIVMEHETAAEEADASHTYFGAVTVTDTPQHRLE
jgi:hypothetical protein